MAMQAHEIERLIKETFPQAQVTITDLAGDGNHYAAEVIDAALKACDQRVDRVMSLETKLRRKDF